MIEFPTHTDLEREPPPLVCGATGRAADEAGCGREWRWIWHVPKGGRHPGRWAAPPVSPCEHCAPSPARTLELEIRERLRRAQIPEPLLHVDLGHVLVQGPGADPAEFQARCRRENALGVLTVNARAVAQLRSWHPRDEHGRVRGLVLHGPPGTGKTTMLAGLARRLLQRPAEQTEACKGALALPLPGQRVVRRARLHGALYERVDELVRREQLKLRSLDPHPLVEVAKDPRVLLLDELGLSERPPEAEVRLVERIVCYRSDHGLVTVIATNRSWDELVGDEPLYGFRVADRLRASVEVALGGPSWRAS